jgi:hypothetical protein
MRFLQLKFYIIAQLLTATSLFGIPLYAIGVLIRIKSFFRQKIYLHELVWIYTAVFYFLCHGLIFSNSLIANRTLIFIILFIFLSICIINSFKKKKEIILVFYKTVLIFSGLFCLYGIYEVTMGPLGFPDFFHIFRNNTTFVESYDTPDGTRQFLRGGWTGNTFQIRANGFYSEPSHAAPIILVLIASIYFSKNSFNKLSIFLIVSLYVGYSLSRTNWLLTFVGFGIIFLPIIIQKLFLLIIFISGILGLYIMQNYVSDYDLSILERLSSTYSGLKIWSEYPFFGIGSVELEATINELTFGTDAHTTIIHSGIVNIMASNGLIGLFLIYGNLRNLFKRLQNMDFTIFLLVLSITMIAHFFYQILIFPAYYTVIIALILKSAIINEDKEIYE